MDDLENELSSKYNIPQGRVLDPILFIIYIKSICE